MERYIGLVQKIREKSKECKALIAEKTELPVYRVKRHKTLAVRIAELTEDLEELCSEKALLLQKFEYAEDAGTEAFRKDIAIMESGLKRLEAQEQKYAAELDKALAEYAELKAQAVDLDPVELHDARQTIRPEKELNAVEQLQRAYGDKYRPLAMLDSKRKASRLLHEYADEQAVQKLKRAQQQKIQSEHTPPNQRKNKSTLNVKLRLDATFFTDKRNRHNTISEASHVRTLAVLIALFYFHHAVAHTNMCLNILWRRLCWLQFFSQCCHKYPQRSHIVIPTAAPDILCDKGMGQYLADILGQQTQQLILNGCQVKFVFIQISASPGIIHFQLTIHKYRTGSKHLCRHQRESSLRHPKSCQQFFYRKGLCQIIVRSGIQRLDFIVILASGADYNNRNIGPRANRLNDLNAIHIRQAQIQ